MTSRFRRAWIPLLATQPVAAATVIPTSTMAKRGHDTFQVNADAELSR